MQKKKNKGIANIKRFTVYSIRNPFCNEIGFPPWWCRQIFSFYYRMLQEQDSVYKEDDKMTKKSNYKRWGDFLY